MKIVFSSFDDMKNPFYSGGGAFSIHEVAKRLAQNHQVTIFTGKYPGSKDEQVDGVFYKRISFFGANPKLCQLIFQFCLPFYLMKTDFDIWFESYTPPFSTAFLPLFTRKRVIGVTHLLGGKEMAKRYKIPFNVIEHFGLKIYKEIVVMNDALKKQVEESNTKCKIYIIPNGENKELINFKVENKQEDYILFLGRIDVNHKGLDYLLDIYKKIVDRTNLDLYIAGGGLQADIENLKKRIKDLNLDSRVKLLGKVVGVEKVEAFRKARLMVMTSRIEAFPKVILEAFCYEVPTIVFNIDVLNWIPADISIKIKPFDVDAFAEKLLTLSEDGQLRHGLAKKGKEFVKNYDWDNIANDYEKLIEAKHHA